MAGEPTGVLLDDLHALSLDENHCVSSSRRFVSTGLESYVDLSVPLPNSCPHGTRWFAGLKAPIQIMCSTRLSWLFLITSPSIYQNTTSYELLREWREEREPQKIGRLKPREGQSSWRKARKRGSASEGLSVWSNGKVKNQHRAAHMVINCVEV